MRSFRNSIFLSCSMHGHCIASVTVYLSAMVPSDLVLGLVLFFKLYYVLCYSPLYRGGYDVVP